MPASVPVHPAPNASASDLQLRLALHDVRRAVDDVIGLYRLPSFNLAVPANHRWDMKDMLAHLVAWHESFARNLALLARGEPPDPPRGTLREVNRGGVDRLKGQSVDQLLRRLRKAQRGIEAHVFNDRITMIPYRRPGTSYTRLQHLDVVAHHIRGHFWEILERSLQRADRSAPRCAPAPAPAS